MVGEISNNKEATAVVNNSKVGMGVIREEGMGETKEVMVVNSNKEVMVVNSNKEGMGVIKGAMVVSKEDMEVSTFI